MAMFIVMRTTIIQLNGAAQWPIVLVIKGGLWYSRLRYYTVSQALDTEHRKYLVAKILISICYFFLLFCKVPSDDFVVMWCYRNKTKFN